MISLNELLATTVKEGASDLHITVGLPPILRINGALTEIKADKLMPEDTEVYAREILGDRYEKYAETGEIDTSHAVPGLGRFRVNIFMQRGSDAIAFRVVALKIPTLSDLHLPSVLKDLTTKQRAGHLQHAIDVWVK